MPYADKEQQRNFQKTSIDTRRTAWLLANGPCRDCGGTNLLEISNIDPKLRSPNNVWSLQEVKRVAVLSNHIVLCRGCRWNRTVKISDKHGATAYGRGCRCVICCGWQSERLKHRKRRRRVALSKPKVLSTSNPNGLKISRSEAGKLGNAKSKIVRLKNRLALELEYAKAPSLCMCCSVSLPYAKRSRKYCGRRCFGKENKRNMAERVATHVEAPALTGTCTFCKKDTENSKNGFCTICNTANIHRMCWRGTETAKTDRGRKKWLLLTRENCCAVCRGLEWLGKKIPLELDHIDGNHKNNVESNLRLICPNCHAQTETYKNKNKGKGRHFRKQRYAEGKTY
jgi:hypothetical protein